MSTQRFTVVVEIDAENNTAQAFGEFNKGVNSTRKSSKLLDGVMMAVGQRLVGLAEQLPAIAAQTFQLGIASQSATLRFERFAGGTERAEELLQAFNVATDGTVDKMGAMTSAARLLQMGLVTDADELANVAEIATKLGDQTASATNRISDFSLLLANQSIPRLDNFGISSGKVRARIAELQKQITGLSREEAFKIAVMEEGRKSLVRLGDVSDTAAVKMDKLKAATKDAQVGFGELLVALVDNVGGVDELAGRIRRLPETFSQVIMLAKAWADAMKVGRGNIFNFDEALEEFNHSLGRQVAAQTDWKVATEEVRFAFTLQQDAVEENIEVLDEYEDGLSRYTTQSFLAEDATRAYTKSQGALALTALSTVEAIEAESDALAAARTQFLDFSTSFTRHQSDIMESAEDHARQREKAVAKFQESVADLEKRGKATRIMINAEEHEAKLTKLKRSLEISLLDQADFNDKTKMSTRLRKDDQIAKLQEQIGQEQQLLNDHYAGKLWRAGENVAGLIETETARYAEEMALLRENRQAQELAQQQSLGRMLIQNFEAWGAMRGLTAEQMIEMRLAISEEYGLITEEGATAARDQLLSWETYFSKTTEEWATLGQDASSYITWLEGVKKAIEAIPDRTVRIRTVRTVVDPSHPEFAEVAVPIDFGGVDVSARQGGGFASGAFIAGEGGPEMIFAPRGAFVANAAQTRSITNNFTMNVNTPSATRVQDDFLLMESLAQ